MCIPSARLHFLPRLSQPAGPAGARGSGEEKPLGATAFLRRSGRRRGRRFFPSLPHFPPLRFRRRCRCRWFSRDQVRFRASCRRFEIAGRRRVGGRAKKHRISRRRKCTRTGDCEGEAATNTSGFNSSFAEERDLREEFSKYKFSLARSRRFSSGNLARGEVSSGNASLRAQRFVLALTNGRRLGSFDG